jgi:hypothetical protein
MPKIKGEVRSRRKHRAGPRPKLPKKPKEPYNFSYFINVVKKDVYYGRALHALIKYAHQNPADETWALKKLSDHVILPDYELSELGIDELDVCPTRCSNNTKFYMVDFLRYV